MLKGGVWLISACARKTATQWVTIDLVAMKNFSENKVNLLIPIEGQAEADKNEILLDKKALEKIPVAVGDNLIFELPNGTVKSLEGCWYRAGCQYGCWRFSGAAACLHGDGYDANLKTAGSI